MSWKQQINLGCSFQTPKCSSLGPQIVNAPLSVIFQYDIACNLGSGSLVGFTSYVTGGVQPYSYNWNFGDGSTSTSASPQHTYTNPGNYTASLIVTDAEGDIQSYSLVINAPSQLLLGSVVTQNPLCNNHTTGTGSFTATGGVSPYTFNVTTNTANANFSQNGDVYSFSNAGPGVIEVTVTDANSCTASSSATITAIDNEAPVLTVPTTGLALGCNPSSLPTVASVTAASSATDDYGTPTITAIAGAVTGTCEKSQPFTVTATDTCGNTDVETVTYTWTEDLIAPVILTTAVSEDKGCNPTIVAPEFTLTEACSPGDIVVATAGVTGTGCAKSQTWTANYTDACNNAAAEVSVTYTWTEDLIAPVISTTAVSGDKGCNPAIVAPVFTLTEACSPGDIVVTTAGVAGTGCEKSQTWTANFTDACNNAADEVSITYSWIEDLVKPVIVTTATNQNLGCNPEAIVPPVFTLTEACSPGTIVVVDGGVQGTDCAKSQTWTANFTDACNNAADEVSITYSWIEDLVKPVITTTATNQNLGCNPEAIVPPVFTLTEACSPGTIVVVDGGVQGTGCAKTQTWTANFTDACGNVADEKVITYTWTEDAIAPIIATTAVSGDKGCNPAIVAPVFTLTEACSPGDIVVTTAGVAGTGCEKSQTWMANFTDECGNAAAEVSVTYTWNEDSEAPVLTVPTAGLALGCNPSSLPTVSSVIEASSATDNCGTPTITAVEGAVTGTCSKSQAFTVTATDACGNTDVETVTYTWVDDDSEAPVLTVPTTGLALGCNPSSLPTEASVIAGSSATDDCGTPAITALAGAITGECTKSQTFTVTATDGCGNTDVKTVTYTWTVDTELPVISTTAVNNQDLGCNPTTITAPVF
ncbi:MAG: hypothetical protein CVT97_08640, partial [Bacteroidetes bacterium HGW-Bacteroidetes-14]